MLNFDLWKQNKCSQRQIDWQYKVCYWWERKFTSCHIWTVFAKTCLWMEQIRRLLRCAVFLIYFGMIKGLLNVVIWMKNVSFVWTLARILIKYFTKQNGVSSSYKILKTYLYNFFFCVHAYFNSPVSRTYFFLFPK